MKVSNALLGMAVSAGLSLSLASQVAGAELTEDLQSGAALGKHPAVIVANRTAAFDPSVQPYRHPAGGESTTPASSGATAQPLAGAFVHVADGVGAAQAQAMLQVVARHVANKASGPIAGAVPQLSTRVRASYVIEDKVINEVQLSGRFNGQYMGMNGHGGLVSESRMEIYQIADGQVVENWSAVGSPSIQQQLAWAVEGSTQLAE